MSPETGRAPAPVQGRGTAPVRVHAVLVIGPPGPFRDLVEEGLREALPGAGIEPLHRPPEAAAGGSRRRSDRGTVAVFLPAHPAEAPPPETPTRKAGAGAEALAAGSLPWVLVSSALVHEPCHHHPGLAPETELDALPPLRRPSPATRAWRELEARADGAGPDAGTPAPRITLRPVPVLVPGGTDPASRFFHTGSLLGRLRSTPPGYDPPLQLLAPEDFVAGLALSVRHVATMEPGTTELYHLAPGGAVSLRNAVRLAGGARLPSPALGPSRGYRPALRHAWTVSGARAREELGFTPARTSAETVRAHAGRDGIDSGEALPEGDPFGADPAYLRRMGRRLFRFLHDVYWRVEHSGLEHVPREGPAVLVGVHRGFMPWDGVMLAHLLERELGRFIRFLIHPSLLKFPVLAPYMMKLGGVPANLANAHRLLAAGELMGVFPEGIRGAFTRYRDAYRLGRFGRGEHAALAIAHQAPIVPVATVGSAEIFPIYGKLYPRWFKRLTEWPCLPLTPTMGLLPLPSKWHTRFLPPIPTAGRYPPEAAHDRAAVAELDREVQEALQTALDGMVEKRKRIFWGSIFEEEPEFQEKIGP